MRCDTLIKAVNCSLDKSRNEKLQKVDTEKRGETKQEAERV